MAPLFVCSLVFVLGECVAYPVFYLVKRRYLQDRAAALKFFGNVGPTLSGMLERACMYIGLLAGFPQILIAFSAIKLGTRLDDERKKKVSNEYFLTGNLISILFSMLYAVIATQWLQLI